MNTKLLAVLGLFSFALTSFLFMPAVNAATNEALPVRLKYSSSNVTTGAYTELVHSTVKGISAVSVLNTGSSAINIALGASGGEVAQLVIPVNSSAANAVMAPTVLPMQAGYGSRLSVISLDQTNSTGELQMNLFYN